MAGIGIPTVDAGLEAAVAATLGVVEARLLAEVESTDLLLNETASHLVVAGGKRFRPLLVTLAAHFGDPDAVGVVSSALVVELTHLATLYHDDVMDEAPLRRGAQSANSRWGNTIAILTGDYLFARASDIVADLGPESVRLQARTFQRLVQGQLAETVGPASGDDALAHYLQVLADKTGSLIATSARLGALHAGADALVVEQLTAFGEHIGVAFQLADDVIDVASASEDSGKTPGTDLREGVPTLPGLYALRTVDADSARLRSLLGRPLHDDDEVTECLTLLRAHPAMDQARTEVRRWADGARALLDPLPEGAARDALAGVCHAVVERTG